MNLDFYYLKIPHTLEYEDIITCLNSSISGSELLKKTKFIKNNRLYFPFLLAEKSIRYGIEKKYKKDFLIRKKINISKKDMDIIKNFRNTRSSYLEALKGLYYRLDELKYIGYNELYIASNSLELIACEDFLRDKRFDMMELCLEPYEIFKEKYIKALDAVAYTTFCADEQFRPGRLEELDYSASYGFSPEGAFSNFYVNDNFNSAYIELFYPILNESYIK